MAAGSAPQPSSSTASSLGHVHDIILEEIKTEKWNRPYQDIVLSSCNGYHAVSFSSAEIEIVEKRCRRAIHLRDLYHPGLEMVRAGQGEGYKALLQFLNDAEKDEKAILNVLDSPKSSETDIAVILAVHLFSKLAPNSSVILCNDVKKLRLSPKYAHVDVMESSRMEILALLILTGSTNVWHGFPDLLVGHVTLKVSMDEGDDHEDSDDSSLLPPGKRECLERPSDEKKSSITLDSKKGSIKTETTGRQIISQTITNAFAQSYLNASLKKKFIPSILCSAREVQVFAYSVKHDFLLYTTSVVELFESVGVNRKFCASTILEIWLALNFHFTGCDADYFVEKDNHKGVVKSGFQDMMREKNVIELYEKADSKVFSFPDKIATSLYKESPWGYDFVVLDIPQSN